MTQLPAVASNIFVFCKKCDADRYHKVLSADAEKMTAKIECEVCHKKSTWKPPKPKKAKSPSAARVPAKRAYTSEFEELKGKIDTGSAVAYNMKALFKTEQTIKHPKFGVGLVKTVFEDKIEVYFEDEARTLVHNRQ